MTEYFFFFFCLVSLWKPGHFLCFDKKKVLLELFVELVWSDAIKIVIVTYVVVSSATTNIVSFLLYCYLLFFFFAPTV